MINVFLAEVEHLKPAAMGRRGSVRLGPGGALRLVIHNRHMGVKPSIVSKPLASMGVGRSALIISKADTDAEFLLPLEGSGDQ